MSEPTLIERLQYQSKVVDSRDIERQGPEYLCELTGRAADRIKELETRYAEWRDRAEQLELQIAAVKALRDEYFDDPWILIGRHEVYAKINGALEQSHD